MKNDFLILNYHSIVKSKTGLFHVDPIYTISSDKFKLHLELLKALKVNVITLDELEIINASSDFSICLTFDDGHPTDHEVVLPILNEYNFKASFFPCLLNLKEQDDRWEKYKNLADNGHTIGSHGVTHKYLPSLNQEDQFYELQYSKNYIEEKTGRDVTIFSLPGGKYNEKVIQLSKEIGYKRVLTTEFGLNNTNNLSFLLNRMSLKNKYSLVLLKSILKQDSEVLRKIRLERKVKKNINRLLGNKLTDKLNYILKL